MVDFSRRTEKTVRAACSCFGNNEKCFKCSGTGMYDKVIDHADSSAGAQLRPTAPVADFASDSRGGNFSVREEGKFDSSPNYEDYSEESSPG